MPKANACPDQELQVRRWEVVDLTAAPDGTSVAGGAGSNIQKDDEAETEAEAVMRCQHCRRRAAWVSSPPPQSSAAAPSVQLCTQHARAHPCAQIQAVAWKVLDGAALRGLMEQHCPPEAVPAGRNKAKLQSALRAFLRTHALVSLRAQKLQAQKQQRSAKVKAHSLSAATLGLHLAQHLDAMFGGAPVNQVLIENQIGPLAVRMKTMQGMITQYFVMRHPAVQVVFVNAINKLKVGEGVFTQAEMDAATDTYASRKHASIDLCRRLFQRGRFAEHAAFFETHRKKDDLADCLLQGLWYLELRDQPGPRTGAEVMLHPDEDNDPPACCA